MDLMLTLIGDPAHNAMDSSIVTEARAALNAIGGETGEPDWLSESEACDVPFSGIATGEAIAAVSLALEGWPVDVIAQPSAKRRKKLLVADMDSTIVAEETLDELADFAGCKPQVERITERAMNGEVGFREALDQRVALLAGMSADTLNTCLTRVSLNPGAETLVRTMVANGAYTALVSGGFTVFTNHVGEKVGFHLAKGNVLEIENGILTGRVVGDIVDKTVKHDTLVSLADAKGLDLTETLAIGDGANDVAMLLAAGLGLAYHAKPVVTQQIRTAIHHTGLTTALFAQGYRRDAFV